MRLGLRLRVRLKVRLRVRVGQRALGNVEAQRLLTPRGAPAVGALPRGEGRYDGCLPARVVDTQP